MTLDDGSSCLHGLKIIFLTLHEVSRERRLRPFLAVVLFLGVLANSPLSAAAQFHQGSFGLCQRHRITPPGPNDLIPQRAIGCNEPSGL